MIDADSEIAGQLHGHVRPNPLTHAAFNFRNGGMTQPSQFGEIAL
jgi:hypothetical protein